MQEYYQDLERTLRRFAEEAQLTIERMQSTEMVEENKKEITDEPTQVYKRLLRYEFEDDSEILFDIKSIFKIRDLLRLSFTMKRKRI